MRKYRNFTQSEMSAKIAMEQTTYSRKERGISPITNEEWERFAKALNTSIEKIKDDIKLTTVLNEVNTFQTTHNEPQITLPLNLFNIMLKYTSKLEEDIQKLKKQKKKSCL
ncbi:helix-turn-helix domain-containing protein [Flavobacterium taihuense]|uniref:Helix-turn-helix transcriptional regulator n=1 Tax=Flavobacterium taihuense TaxID=2857508 RepID=A0ABS6XXE1_9FLAO|nr:helix-turn-helix transcriptional regulator [Flavobacterium taihuense]MBW4361239.1 helix-turn-helix transcriptional regulator [Flavobacterium taihuense]